jgi:23S rRNA (cytosine1962-C5)-methyltransferase
MNSPHQSYEFIDFGNGRKLERFGEIVVDRPCPAAIQPKSSPEAWLSAELIYDGSRLNGGVRGGWVYQGRRVADPEGIASWECGANGLRFHVKPQQSGQLGLFPEHWNTWPWIEDRIAGWLATRSAIAGDRESSIEPSMDQATDPVGNEALSTSPASNGVPRVLHLFAYTGATTLAMASYGASVTHVDAMESAVAWARENARCSGLSEKPIRWIVDDARLYVARELRRGKRYELIVLDPPSYGHGVKGKAWEIHRDLMPLMHDCWKLLSDSPIGIVFTGHSRDVSMQKIRAELENSPETNSGVACDVTQAKLVDLAGRALDCGYVASFEPASM